MHVVRNATDTTTNSGAMTDDKLQHLGYPKPPRRELFGIAGGLGPMRFAMLDHNGARAQRAPRGLAYEGF